MNNLKAKYFLLILFATVFSCRKENTSKPKFQLLEADQTGLHFSNDLVPTKDLNIFSYMYFYNGSGVGAGDFNNDGLVDLCFTGNISENRLYLNKGKMKFEDVTSKTTINQSKGWANGISVVDINQDGLLDLYISQVGGFEKFDAHNLLFVCKEITKEGVPIYEEKSTEYGLNLKGLGTQAAFFDYDIDGDLDMFQLNHSVHQNGTFGFRKNFQGKSHPTAGDKLYRNENGKYSDVTQQAAIIDDVLGYGLGVAIGDVNFDGYPDMYIGNDFHENDYLYINQRNGAFKEDLDNQIKHTSQFTMGIDIGDINNDVFPEIISLDMLPYDKEILKRSEGEDSYNIYKYKIRQGYNNQFARNNLQLNNRNNTFSEIGMYANVHATDWSWSPLWMDFDNDGRKDLFISNGIPKRMNDIDYILFMSDEAMQEKLDKKEFDENDKSLIDKLPEIKIPNKFFQNTPSLAFLDIENTIKNNKESYSNGAIYADLDNDGDLDIITNNINDKVFVYENLADATTSKNASLTLQLKGPEKNKNAIGTKCLVFKNNEIITYEKFPVRGFQSSAEGPLTIGLGNKATIDSLVVIWPDNTYQKLVYDTTKQAVSLSYSPNLPLFNYEEFNKDRIKGFDFQDITSETKLNFTHIEDNFNEFDREALIPHLMSSEGPALAVGDVNNDGLDDAFIGAARGNSGKVFLQNKNGTFAPTIQPDLETDATYEDIDASFADVNNDGFVDLVVGSGGNQFFGKSEFLQPRLYLNDGHGKLTRKKDAFPTDLFINAASVLTFDFTSDGSPDLFIAGRVVPFQYGITPKSYLLKNDGSGKFSDITPSAVASLGMIKSSTLTDLDKDNDMDILIAVEWGKVYLLENSDGKFTPKPLTKENGWWNFIKPFDFDNDGDTDILVGNLGQNSRLKASQERPLRLYVNDFDANGSTDQVLTFYIKDEEVIFANKKEAEKQFPYIKKEFIFAKDFAKATIGEILGKDKLAQSKVLEASYLSNAILENNGNGEFILKSLPQNAQFAPYYTAEIMDVNNDKLSDVLLMGNFYDCNIQMGRYDADYGTLLLNKGKNHFEKVMLNGLVINGQVKRSKPITIKGAKAIVIAKNNDTVQVIKTQK